MVTTAFCALYLERAGMRALEAVFFGLIGTMGGTFGARSMQRGAVPNSCACAQRCRPFARAITRRHLLQPLR